MHKAIGRQNRETMVTLNQKRHFSSVAHNLQFILNEQGLWLGLGYLTALSTIFQLYLGGQFYWWRKMEYPKKTTYLHKTLTNISHTVVSSTPRHERDSDSQG